LLSSRLKREIPEIVVPRPKLSFRVIGRRRGDAADAENRFVIDQSQCPGLMDCLKDYFEENPDVIQIRVVHHPKRPKP
jgi:hypothetical protein